MSANPLLPLFPRQLEQTIDEIEINLPETPLELSQCLGLTQLQKSTWAWYELSGAVLAHYVIDHQQRVQRLLDWFYGDLGFQADDNVFGASAADLAACLLNRRGSSTSLAMLLSLLAKQLDLNFEALLLPGHTFLAYEFQKQTHYLDPLTGHWVDLAFMHKIVRGELGNSMPLNPHWLTPVSEKRLLTRMMHEVKAGSIVMGQFETALACCNLLLLWHPDDLHLLRERAFVSEQLGCFTLAATDLQQFVEQNPHDPMIDIVKGHLQSLNEAVEVFH